MAAIATVCPSSVMEPTASMAYGPVSGEPRITAPMVRAPRTQATPRIPATQIPFSSPEQRRLPLPRSMEEEEDVTDVDVPVEEPPR